MDPYYSDDAVTIYHGDCLDILPALPIADLVVTDPPYIIGAMSAGQMDAKANGRWPDMMNSALWFGAWIGRLKIRHEGALWQFCNWRTLPVLMRAACDQNLPVASMLVWDKETIGPGGPNALRPAYELVALLPRPGFNIPNRSVSDVWRCKSGGKPHDHPAEKPEPLVSRIIQVSEIPQRGVVLDPFMGSGTTLAAAKRLGHRSIGIDAEERWCEGAAQRIAQGVLAL